MNSVCDEMRIIYHGSQEIIELPEIRIQKYNKDLKGMGYKFIPFKFVNN